jgi:cobalamin biosynthetic protein CobC
VLEHGGNLNDAVKRFERPREQWLDLSTGINPQPYPVPPLAADAWHRLPEAMPELAAAACAYYNAPALLPVAGTQAAIQTLPGLRPTAQVVIGAPAYAEHAYRWAQAGHAVREVPYRELGATVDDCDVMVVCNPNNPTGERIPPEVLHQWAQRLAWRGGWLVVDEAFGDTAPDQSIAAWSNEAGVVVLRSVGKFFGLAGLRLGFVGANPVLLADIAEALGPWSVSRPAQEIGHAALADRAWQESMRAKLLLDGKRLKGMLEGQGIRSNGTALFQWWGEALPESFHHHMAERGIWVRLFPGKARGVRLGLPLHESDWQRLEKALAEWRKNNVL